jgi:hypothetical protein
LAAEITIDTIRALALAAGLNIPDERLPLVLQQYRSFLRTLDRLEALNLPPETEPATTFLLRSDGVPTTAPGRR